MPRCHAGAELMNVSKATAGEMWLEFKVAMSGDMKQEGGSPEVSTQPLAG